MAKGKSKAGAAVVAFQLRCTKCNKVFYHKLNTPKLCKQCHTGGKPVTPKPQQPKPQKQRPPKRPRPPKQTKPISYTEVQTPEAIAMMAASRSAPLRSLGAMRTATVSGAKASRSSAIQRLTEANIDPLATIGAPAPALAEDAVQQPKLPYAFPTMFELIDTSEDGIGFKVQLIPSPVYCLRVMTEGDIGQILCLGAAMDRVDARTALVRGSKFQYVGVIDSEEFTPSADWTKFRVLSNSARFEWTGPALEANGRYYIARANPETDPLTFNPMSTADVAVFNVTDVVTASSQHVEPTYEWQQVDENNAEADDKNDEPLVSETVFHDEKTTFTPTPPTVKDFITKVAEAITARAEFIKGAAGNQLDRIDAKWGLYNERSLRRFDVKEMTLAVAVTGDNYNATTTAGKLLTNMLAVANITHQHMGDTTPDVMVAHLSDALSRLVDKVLSYGFGDTTMTAWNNFASWGFTLMWSFTFLSSRVTGGQPVPRYHLPRRLMEAEHRENVGTFFYDDHMRTPVIAISSKKARISIAIQLYMELAVDDASPFTEVINRSGGSIKTAVSKSELQRFAKAMASMPPAISLTNDGAISTTSRTAMQSRGILGTIAGLIGGITGINLTPLASALEQII